MLPRVVTCLLSLLVVVSLGRAQDGILPPAVRAAADAITAEGLARDLAWLASDDLRGRDTGSAGFNVAADYIIERLRAAGIAPAGDHGTYRQHYDLVEMRVATRASALEIQGRRFPFGDGFVLVSFAGPIDATAPVVYVGHGWRVPDAGIDPYAEVDVRGALVLAHSRWARTPGEAIERIGRVAVGATSVLDEARSRGALGVIFLTTPRDGEPWAQLRDRNLVRRELDPPVPSAYAAPPVTSLVLSEAAGDALLAGEDTDRATLVARGEAVDYPPSFRLRTHVTVRVVLDALTRTQPFNVVARIGGTDSSLRDEVITMAAHLDGAVGTREVDGDGIYNSADDNASGSAALLAIAEQLAKAPPRRSIVFLWDSGEERGLWGSRQFVHDPPVPLDSIVAHVNVDMVGATRAPGTADAESKDVAAPHEMFVLGPRVLSPTADALLERVNAAYLGMTLNRQHDTADSEFFYPRTDAGPFLERGILTIGFTTGTHPRYHLPSDEAEHLDPAKMEAVARTVLAGVWALASADERPRIELALPPSVPRY